jgi:hypothetical protein
MSTKDTPFRKTGSKNIPIQQTRSRKYEKFIQFPLERHFSFAAL